MDKITQEYVVRKSLADSIDREDLMLKKYNEYEISIHENELKELLDEFKETAREHIELIKGKLNKLSL